MLRLAFDFIITWRETRTRPNAYFLSICMAISAGTLFDGFGYLCCVNKN